MSRPSLEVFWLVRRCNLVVGRGSSTSCPKGRWPSLQAARKIKDCMRYRPEIIKWRSTVAMIYIVSEVSWTPMTAMAHGDDNKFADSKPLLGHVLTGSKEGLSRHPVRWPKPQHRIAARCRRPENKPSATRASHRPKAIGVEPSQPSIGRRRMLVRIECWI